MSLLDLSDVSAGGEYSIIPEGYYDGEFLSAEINETKSGGKKIDCKFVLDNKRVIFHSFNIVNDNAMAVKIAKEQLKSFLILTGQDGDSLESLKQLLYKRVTVKVKHRKDDYGTKAVIHYFKKCETPSHSPFDDIAVTSL